MTVFDLWVDFQHTCRTTGDCLRASATPGQG